MDKKKKIIIIAAVAVCVVLVAIFAFTRGGKDERVKIDISASSLSAEDLKDLDAYAEENGYISAKHNKRAGTVTLVIDDMDHRKMLYQLGVSVISNVYGMMDSNSPYNEVIRAIERNDEFTQFWIDVDRELYESDPTYASMITLTGNSSLVYLSYSETPIEEQKCTVTIRDALTKEIIVKQEFVQE